MKSYVILEETVRAGLLEERVEKMLSDGWALHGHLIVIGSGNSDYPLIYVQAMTLDE